MNDDFEELDYDPDLLTMVDEDGVEHEFEIADSLELDDVNYVALIPIYQEAEDSLNDSAELIVLKVMDEDGVECLEAIEDEEEFDKISDMFMERLNDEYDFEE